MYSVSVIVPVYNVESVLKKCLDSLKNQTLENIQVILVDDGSTDASGRIAQDYCRVCRNFEYYKKKNSGPSDARNMALEHVKGEYIAFLDSDDWVESDAYETLYGVAKNYDTDIVFYRVFEDETPGALNYIFPRGGYYDKKQIEQELYPYLLPTLLENGDFKSIRWSNCIRLYRTELIERNTIRYPKRSRMFEDCYFSFVSTVKAESYYYFDERPLYHNVAYPGSATRHYMKNMLASTNTLYDGIKTVLAEDHRLNEIFSVKLSTAGVYLYARCVENELSIKSMPEKTKKVKEVLNCRQCIECIHENSSLQNKGYYPRFFAVMKKRKVSLIYCYKYMRPTLHRWKISLYKKLYKK